MEAMQMQTALHDPDFLTYLISKGSPNSLQVVQLMFQKSQIQPWRARICGRVARPWAGTRIPIHPT
jgi:hypothetical protein